MTRRAVTALVVLVLLAGCGGSAAGGEEGTAQLWVTRDRGAEVLVETEVEAGQTLMRALNGEVELETSYGGRFVQAIDGLAGSLAEQRDWFWFVNGYEGDTSAGEYRLRDGDIAWLDYRGWAREGEARVVVGAFPEPFRHGYGGRVREAVVRHAPGLEERARELAEEIGAASVAALGEPVPEGANVLEVRRGPAARPAGANVLEVRRGPARLQGELLGQTAGDPVRFTIAGEPAYEHRYAVP